MKHLLWLLIFCITSYASDQGFFKGEKVTCIYSGVFSWDDGEEYIKNISVQCKVLEASDFFEEYSHNYQSIKVDCTEGLKDKWDNGPGTGLVKNQKYQLNKTILWYTSDECYHYGG